MDTRQCVELFHLLFLGALGARVDRALFVLKGGCNLRFYWKSIRYSEDMDLDVKTMSVTTLRNNVERILESLAFQQSLAAHQLALEEHSAPKQTDTTQRWKMAVRSLAERRSVPTKIEFSRRRLDPGHILEPVDPAIQRRYKLYPVLTQHYDLSAALLQKVGALAGRPQTQARDVFDLKLLLDQGATAAKGLGKLAAAAIEPAMSVGYDEFAGQVLAYLEPEYQDHYRPRQTWEATQEAVVQWLESQAKP
jgi:predicted nucleotidyltransferase component of viral defense system